MRTVTLTPSGTMPIALPPEHDNGFLRRDVSHTMYQPLSAVYGNGTPVTLETKGVREGTEDLKLQNNDLATLAAYGPLNTPAGGMPQQVWLASPSVTPATLIKQTTFVTSPALREAWRRLLLSQALPPVAGTSATLAGPNNWLVVRAQTLEHSGLYEAAWSLWRQAGAGARSQNIDLAKGWVQAGLLAGQTAEACALAREKAATGTSDSFWPSAVAACAAADAQATGTAGSAAGAAALGLSLQLLPAEVGRTNPALLAALTAVRDGKPLALGPVNVGALAGSVVAAYPILLSPSALPLLPDVALRRLRETVGLPAELRMQVASQLAAQTGWPQDGAAFVRLVSGTSLQGTPALWPDAGLVAWARLSSNTTQTISASALIVPAALRLGDVSTATAWWPVWQTAQLDLPLLKPRLQSQLALQAFTLGTVQEDVLQQWLLAQSVGTPNEAEAAQRVLLALEGVGARVPSALWEAYRDRAVAVNDGTDASWRRLLDAAVSDKNVPSVIGLVSEGLAGQRASEAPPGVVGTSIQALMAVGQPDIARRLMVEAVTLQPMTSPNAMQPLATRRRALSMDDMPASPTPAASETSAKTSPPPKAPPRANELLPPPRIHAPQKPTVPTIKKPVI